MKILHLNDDLGYGGAETLLMSYIPELKDHDHVIATFSDVNFFTHVTDQYSYYHLDGRAPRNLITLVRKLKDIIAKEKVDIVHSHSYWTNIVSRLATPSSKKLVNHYHFADFDTLIQNYKVRLQLAIDKRMGHRNLQRVAVSEYVHDILKKNFPKGRNSCLPNFANGDKTSGLHPVTYQKGDPLKIVAVGNISIEKGYELLIKAFEQLKDYPITMDVFGEGPARQGYLQELQEKGITALQFRGNEKSTPTLLREYDLYSSTSISETFGIALLEAIFAGLPVLISDIHAFREVAPASARFFTKGSSEDFARQVLDIYHQGVVPDEMQYQQVLKKYSKDTFLQTIRGLYNN